MPVSDHSVYQKYADMSISLLDMINGVVDDVKTQSISISRDYCVFPSALAIALFDGSLNSIG